MTLFIGKSAGKQRKKQRFVTKFPEAKEDFAFFYNLFSFLASIPDYSSDFLVYAAPVMFIILPESHIKTGAMYNILVKDNIRTLRKARNITQEEMALKMGISLTAYRDLEKGRTAIINSNISKIADILEISVEEIILGYIPVKGDGKELEDVRARYGGQITNLETRVSDLENLVESLYETIRSKDEIITMLKKSLDKQE